MQLHIVPLYFWTDVLVTAAALSVSWYGNSRGGPVERVAARFYAVAWIGSATGICLAFVPALRGLMMSWQLAWLWDVWLAVVFLYLAIRHQNRWMAIAAIAQGVQMGVRAVGLIVDEVMTPFDIAMAMTVSVMSFVMMGCILGSTLSHRRRLRREAATVAARWDGVGRGLPRLWKLASAR